MADAFLAQQLFCLRTIKVIQFCLCDQRYCQKTTENMVNVACWGVDLDARTNNSFHRSEDSVKKWLPCSVHLFLDWHRPELCQTWDCVSRVGTPMSSAHLYNGQVCMQLTQSGIIALWKQCCQKITMSKHRAVVVACVSSIAYPESAENNSSSFSGREGLSLSDLSGEENDKGLLVNALLCMSSLACICYKFTLGSSDSW